MVYQFTKRRIDSPAYGWICTVGFLFLAAFLVGPDGGLAADRIDVSSKIRSVSLFPRQALVTREASLAVDKGLCELALAIDAANVDADSVSARVFGDGELFSVQLKKIYLRAAAQENIRTLEKRLHELRISRRQAEDDKAVIAKKERFLKSVVDFSATQLPREIQTVYPGMDDLQKTLTFLGDRFDELSRGKQTLDGKIDSVDKEIRIVEKELAALARPSDKKKQIVEIIFDSSTAQQIRIETDYLVRNAFWQPLYKAAVPTAMNHVDLTLFSRIRQQTGEDWNAVELSLSNIVPLRGATLPRLPGWYLDIVRPPVSARYRKKDAIEEKMGAARDKEMTLQAESAARAPSVSIAVAKRTELPLSFAYRMPRRLSVESREKETLLPVYRKTLEGTFLHLAVPRRSPFPFLVCRTAADREMMAGPMNVHFGSHFVGKTFLAEGARRAEVRPQSGCRPTNQDPS